MSSMRVNVVIPAAGMGKRFRESARSSPQAANVAGRSKIECDLAGRPVFLRTIERFAGRPDVAGVILAVNPDAVAEFRFRWEDQLEGLGVSIVPGGRAERWETVLNALDALDDDCTHVAVHDAARPLATSGLIDRVFAAARTFPAVIPAVSVSATIKRVADRPEAPDQPADPMDAILGDAPAPHRPTRSVVETVDRSDLVEVQTPQVFARDSIVEAYAALKAGRIASIGVTDDASLIEASGGEVVIVEGETTNLKITRAEDLTLAEAIHRMLFTAPDATPARVRLFDDDD